MASTYSDLKIELIGTGEQTGTWGTTTNDNFSIAIGEAITGSADVAFSSADVTVTLTNTNASQAARNLRLNLTGTSGGARNLILGSGCQIDKLYLINNGLADAVTVKNTSGTGIAVPAGKTMFVYNNGTDVVEAVNSAVTLDVTTLDATNIEVTNIKAKDGTASATIANSTGVMTVASSVLTTTDINGGTIDGTTIGGASAAAGNFTTLGASSTATLNTLASSGATLTGGSINGMAIGGSTAAAGNFTTLGATGVATFSAGSVSAPAITTTGDTNTGIYFPAADTIAFTEGGVESMRLDSSGNLGLGTSSPSNKLDVISTSNANLIAQVRNLSNGSSAYSTYALGNDTNANAALIALNSSTNTGLGGANALNVYHGLSAPIVFFTNATEKMRITSAGNVGIGTSSPNQLLQVYNATAVRLMVGSSTTYVDPYGSFLGQNVSSIQVISANTGGAQLQLGYTGTTSGDNTGSLSFLTSGTSATEKRSALIASFLTAASSTDVSGNLTFFTNNAGTIAERMRIDSSGNVLVGTTSTSFSSATRTVLAIGSGANGSLIDFQISGGTSDGYIYYDGTNATIENSNAGYIRFNTSAAERMRIDSSGNVGIGTTSIGGRLALQVSSGTGAIAYKSTTGGFAAYQLYTSNENVIGTIGVTSTNDTFYLGYTSTPVLTWNNSGNVDIGGTSPSQLFTVALVAGGQGIGFGETTSNYSNIWSSYSAADFVLAAGLQGSKTAEAFTSSFGGGSMYRSAIKLGAFNNTGIQFFTDDTSTVARGTVITPTERMRITVGGDVGIGTSSPSSKLTVQGAIRHEYASNTALYTTLNYDGISVVGAQDAYYLVASGRNQTWYVGATERMRIDSSGNLLIGTTSNYGGRRLDVRGSNSNNYVVSFTNTNASPYGLQIYYDSAAPNDTAAEFLNCQDSGATRAAFRSNGGLANYSGNNVNLSDAREKTNVKLASSYLDKICAIPVKTFNYIDQNREEDDGLTLGVIAQDVQAVAPELVMESNWAGKDQPEKMRLSIYQTDLQYALMKSIQELKAELDSVKAELQTLKGN
jgi:hypothetical protein